MSSRPDLVPVNEIDYQEPKARASRARKFQLLSVDDLSMSVERDCIIKPILGRGELGVLYGPPKSKKSFTALYLCWCLSSGHPFFGMRVKQSRALYLACGEGQGGLGNRVRAAEKQYGAFNKANFNVIAARVDLRQSEADLSGIIELAKDFDLIVVDTLSRALNGSDSNEDYIGALIANADRIREEAGVYVLLIHHTGWEKSRMRGSTMIWGALDVCLRVADDMLTVEDARECESGQSHHFRVERVHLGVDSDDDEISSLAIVETDGPLEGLTGLDVLEVQNRLIDPNETRRRESSQSPDWWGYIVAEVVGINPETDDGMKRAKDISKIWLKSPSFEIDEEIDANRKTRKTVRVGISARATS